MKYAVHCPTQQDYDTLMRVNSLTALRPTKKRASDGGVIWLCVCDCGKRKLINKSKFNLGRVKSCGCAKRGPLTHGMSKTKFYNVWCAMKRRCDYEKDKRFNNYGGRGIKYQKDWEYFVNFKRDMLSAYEEHIKNNSSTTLERINVNGDYSKNNCKWITFAEQGNNKTNNYYINFKGDIKTLTQWAKEVGLKPLTLRYRLKKNWDLEKALFSPLQENITPSSLLKKH